MLPAFSWRQKLFSVCVPEGSPEWTVKRVGQFRSSSAVSYKKKINLTWQKLNKLLTRCEKGEPSRSVNSSRASVFAISAHTSFLYLLKERAVKTLRQDYRMLKMECTKCSRMEGSTCSLSIVIWRHLAGDGLCVTQLITWWIPKQKWLLTRICPMEQMATDLTVTMLR